jgi:hypothetical protein
MSAKELGDAFEDFVAETLTMRDGWRIERHVDVLGKNVDILLHALDDFGTASRIAVECKDYGRPLTREQLTAILSDYSPCLKPDGVDRLFVVTRKGLVANAKKIVDGRQVLHLAIHELEDLVWRPKFLIENMISQFEREALNEYFVDISAPAIDFSKISENYDLVYNEFMDFVSATIESNVDENLSEGRPAYHASNDIEYYLRRWNRSRSQSGASERLLKNRQLLKTAIELRFPKRAIPVDQLVLAWLRESNQSHGLALLGSYGTGKSTVAKKVAYDLAKSYLAGSQKRIPLLIELREFGSHQSIEGLVTHILTNVHRVRNGSFDFFRKLLERGRLLVILDGFDEMKQGMTEDALFYNFNEIAKLLGSNSKVLLCGRPTAFQSDIEQAQILSARSDRIVNSEAKYVQIPLLPLDHSGILSLLRKFSVARHKKNFPAIEKRIRQIERLLPGDVELNALLRRPVHIPMLVTILPDYDDDVQSLTRTELYGRFIEKIIAREMQKLTAAYSTRYSRTERRRFAAALAMRMLLSNNLRSIRQSEIPDSLFEPFMRSGDNVEITRRDLTAACFLERKAPDILIFGHKSFGEYLVAETLYELLKSGEKIGPYEGALYKEIFQFLLDFLDEATFAKALAAELIVPETITTLIRTIVRSAEHVVESRSFFEVENPPVLSSGKLKLDIECDVSQRHVGLAKSFLAESTYQLLRNRSASDGTFLDFYFASVAILTAASVVPIQQAIWCLKEFASIRNLATKRLLVLVALRSRTISESEAARLLRQSNEHAPAIEADELTEKEMSEVWKLFFGHR